MACTTQKRAAFQVMGSKTMQCSPAFPLVLTSYKLLEIERTVIETCLTATLRPIPSHECSSGRLSEQRSAGMATMREFSGTSEPRLLID
jgi:hypothetical protein